MSEPRRFDDLLSLLEHLEATHDPDAHLYRGQLRRYQHLWVDGGELPIEALYPADYRFITKYQSWSSELWPEMRASRAYGRKMRDLFIQALITRTALGDPSYAWLAPDVEEYIEHMSQPELFELAKTSDEDLGPMSTSAYRLLWSLAQHYFLATALTDVTFSPRIAAWFASQPWDPGEPAPTDGTGVVYRFRRPDLEAALDRGTERLNRLARREDEVRAPDMFLVDIRRIPADFAARPHAQQGGSIYGLDQPHVLRDVFETGCADIFEFDHSSRAKSLTSLRSVVNPENDPFTRMIELLGLAVNAAKPKLVPPGPIEREESVASEHLHRLALVAGLPIRGAQLVQRIPVGTDYVGYHFTNIESSGKIGYANLLVVVHEKTGGPIAYVSAEPLNEPDDEASVQRHVLALWGDGKRVVVDVAPGLDEPDEFASCAVMATRIQLGLDDLPDSLDLGLLIMSFGGITQAIDEHRRIVAGGDLAAAVNLGSLLQFASRYQEAEAVWRRAADQGSADAASNLGGMLLALHRFDDAATAYRRARELGDVESN